MTLMCDKCGTKLVTFDDGMKVGITEQVTFTCVKCGATVIFEEDKTKDSQKTNDELLLG